MDIYDNIFNSIELVMPKYNEIEKRKLAELKKDKRLYGIEPVCIDILFNRGLRSYEDIEKHLYSTLNNCHNPELLADSEEFIAVLIDSLNKKEHIVIYSDYDADGIGGAIIPVLALRNIGANVDYYTNNRFIEGYGITPKGVDNLVETYPDVKLIITTDNGIVGFDGIKRANELGLKVLVTDHHDPAVDEKDKTKQILPKEALAIVNPKRNDCDYPFKGLCGAGVIFKLMQLLYWELNEDMSYIYGLVDILALSTVGDLVPLLDENRIFVKEGIRLIKDESRLAFKKLREALKLETIDEETFGYQYCPMLNALGRIDGSPDDAIELFTIEDEAKMEKIVQKMVAMNDYRKQITKEQEELGIQMVECLPELPNVIVLHHDTFNEGVVGLVAGRLKEKYNRPVIVLATHSKDILNADGSITTHTLYKGSARSIEGFHIKQVFDTLKQYLAGYGGHSMAGGLSIEPNKLDDFIKAINEEANNILLPENYIKKVMIDAPLKSSEITKDLILAIDSLKPFGMCFSKPRFGLSNFKLDRVKNKEVCVGKDKCTLRLVSDDNLTLVMFKYAERFNEIHCPNRIKAVGYPVLNIFNGNTYPQFRVENNYIFHPEARKPLPLKKSS